MDRTVLLAIGGGVVLATGMFGFRGQSNPEDSRMSGAPAELRVMLDSRYDGLPTEARGFAPHGWISVTEPPPRWNPQGAGVTYPICPRPDWFPYDAFLGPPVPEVAVAIDPAGYMFQTGEGIRVHRDGWVVTADGRAFRAEELIDDMTFPAAPNKQGVL